LSLAEKVVRGEACNVNRFLTRFRQLEASRSGETDTFDGAESGLDGVV